MQFDLYHRCVIVIDGRPKGSFLTKQGACFGATHNCLCLPKMLGNSLSGLKSLWPEDTSLSWVLLREIRRCRHEFAYYVNCADYALNANRQLKNWAGSPLGVHSNMSKNDRCHTPAM